MSAIDYKNSNLSTHTVVQTNNDRRFFIKINKGAERGSVFQLSSNEILIGRDPSNHIQLKNDSKVSRQHVRLLFKNNSYIIEDITKNNFIVVNGIKTKHVELKNNEVIQIGDHVLQYIETEPKSKKSSNQKTNKQQPNNLRIILIAIIVLGGGFYLFTPTSNNKKIAKVDNYDSIEKTERRISNIDDSIKELDQKFKDSLYYSENGRNAEAIFIQGKRDFDQGQFFYARDAFRAVLSLEPKHQEARRLLRLSLQFSDNLLENQFKDSIANKDVGRYEQCMAGMKNIMNLINDPMNARYREAKKILVECDLKKRGNL